MQIHLRRNSIIQIQYQAHIANLNKSQQSLAENFGRVPVQLRSYIRYLASFPGGNSAFNQGNNIAFFGTTPESISVHIHEVGHSIDSDAYNDGHPFHGR